MAANPKVREDAGKVALEFGPCVYCLEETDNGGDLASVFVDPDATVRQADNRLPGGLPILACEGRRLCGGEGDEGLYSQARFTMQSVSLTAVPYCIWGNRQPGEMAVWQKALLPNK